MADPGERYEDNVPGPFYTDRNCVLCNECFELAPGHFRMSKAGDHMIVHQQPGNGEQRALCERAMAGCPMDAVGDDGGA